MCKKLVCLASIILLFSLSATVGHAQLLGSYDFDGGGDVTSWSDPNNWEQVTDPNGAPLSGNPATSPGPLTTANVGMAGVSVAAAGQTALDANIGTAAAAGSLSMSPGQALAAGRDFSLGNTNTGTFAMTGGTLSAGDDIFVGNSAVGTMTMSGGAASAGDDFFINTDSSFIMTGGTVSIGDRLVMDDDPNVGGNASLTLSNGAIIADDDFFFFGNSQVTVNSGSMVVKDKMRFDGDPNMNGKLTINGGFVRSDEFHFSIVDPNTDFRGVVEINGDGFYDVQNKEGTLSNLSVGLANFLIAQGNHFITSEVAPKGLGAFAVTLGIGEFFGNTVPLSFTRIAVVPEPASVLLLSLGSLGLLLRRKRAR